MFTHIHSLLNNNIGVACAVDPSVNTLRGQTDFSFQTQFFFGNLFEFPATKSTQKINVLHTEALKIVKNKTLLNLIQ